MKISEIFIGKASDRFLRRYAFVLFAFTYIVIMSNIWPDPKDRPYYIALAGGWITIFGFFAWYYAIKTKSAYRLLTKQYPSHDFTTYSTSHIRLMGYAKKHSPESNVLGVSVSELKGFVKQLKEANRSKKGFFSQMADSYKAGKNATGSYGSNNPSTGKNNSIPPLSGNSDMAIPKASSLWPECTQGGTITKWDGKNLEYQIQCTHCGDDQRPKGLNGGYVYNTPQPIRVTVNSEHDLNITYGYVCNICGRQSETRIRNGNG
jgi:hypothetical protein